MSRLSLMEGRSSRGCRRGRVGIRFGLVGGTFHCCCSLAAVVLVVLVLRA